MHTRLLEVRCGLCVTVLILGAPANGQRATLCPLVVCIGWRMGGGAPICAGAQRGAPLPQGGNGHTSEHGTGAEQDARARQKGAPSLHRADVAPTFRGRSAPSEMIRQFSHSPHAPLTGALPSLGLGAFDSAFRTL